MTLSAKPRTFTFRPDARGVQLADQLKGFIRSVILSEGPMAEREIIGRVSTGFAAELSKALKESGLVNATNSIGVPALDVSEDLRKHYARVHDILPAFLRSYSPIRIQPVRVQNILEELAKFDAGIQSIPTEVLKPILDAMLQEFEREGFMTSKKVPLVGGNVSGFVTCWRLNPAAVRAGEFQALVRG
jgi:hypothetical protein